MRLACKFTFFSPNALRFARFFCVRQRHAHDFSLSPPLCDPSPPRERAPALSALPHNAHDRVENRSFSFLLFSFFLSLSLPQGGGFFFEGLNNSFSITSSLFYYIYGVGRTHPVYICPCRGVAFGAHLPKGKKRIAPPRFPLGKCFLVVPSFAAKVAYFSEKIANFCPKRPHRFPPRTVGEDHHHKMCRSEGKSVIFVDLCVKNARVSKKKTTFAVELSLTTCQPHHAKKTTSFLHGAVHLGGGAHGGGASETQ